MSKIIFNADDYGLHRDIDLGILMSIDDGFINSVSVAASNATSNSANQLIKRNVSTGLHVTLTELPWMTKDYLFKDWKQLFQSILFRRAPSSSEIEIEIQTQIKRMRELKLRIDHLDSHQNIHVFPSLWKSFVKCAIESSIPRIRRPSVPSVRCLSMDIESIGLYLLSKTRKQPAKLKAFDCIGLPASSGRFGNAKWLSQQLYAAKDDDIELVLHPALQSTDLCASFGYWGIDWKEQLDLARDKNIYDLCLKLGYSPSSRKALIDAIQGS